MTDSVTTSADVASTGGEQHPRSSRRMKALAASLPIVVLLVLELLFRVVGLFPDNSKTLNAVGFESSAEFFPQWDRELGADKPQDEWRVFTLGGSCTYGFGVDRPFGDLLADQLTDRVADVRSPRRVRVINGGYPAYGSHRVLEIARRAAEFSPDCLVVYMGHNEFLEDVFYDPEGLVARMEQAGQWARSLRVINGVRALLGEPTTTVQSQLPAEFFGNENYPLIKSPGEVPLRMALLEQHVAGIVAAGKSVGARVVVVPAVPNLLAPPGDSLHGSGVDATSGAWSDLERQADHGFAARDWAALLKVADEMVRRDGEYAQGHFWQGLGRLGQGDVDRGRASLVEANRWDRRGTRANPAVIETITRSAREAGAVVVSVQDRFDRELQKDFQRLAAGGEQALFLDHCHPTQRGHALIAEAVRDAAAPVTGSAKSSAGRDAPAR